MAPEGREHYRVRSFRPADQAAAQCLVMDGLRGHFGWLDPALNPDLTDIAVSYEARGHVFLVAETGGAVIGTGALLAGDREGQIVRVSVDAAHRRKGVAHAVVAGLFAEAEARGMVSVWMETNEDWLDAIGFYRAEGFRPFDHREGCIFMRREVSPQP